MTSRQRLNAVARVRVVLLVDGGVWAGDATFDQIHGAAATQAQAVVERILMNAIEAKHLQRASIVGRPEVLEVNVVPEGKPE